MGTGLESNLSDGSVARRAVRVQLCTGKYTDPQQVGIGQPQGGAAPQRKPPPWGAFSLRRERSHTGAGLQRSPRGPSIVILSLYFDPQVHGYAWLPDLGGATVTQERRTWHLEWSQEAGEAPQHLCPRACTVGMRAMPATLN